MEPESYSQIPASFVIFITCVDYTQNIICRPSPNNTLPSVVESFLYLQCRTSGVHIDEGVSLLSLIRNLTVSTKTRITTTLIICFSMCHYYSPSRTAYPILTGVGYCVMFIRLRFCQNLLSDKQRTTPHFLFFY